MQFHYEQSYSYFILQQEENETCILKQLTNCVCVGWLN